MESIRGFRPSYESMREVMLEPQKAFYLIAEGKLPFYFMYYHMTENVELRHFMFKDKENRAICGRDTVYRYLFDGSPRSDGEYLRCGFGGKVYIMDASPAHEAVIIDDSAYGEPIIIIPEFNYMKLGKLDRVMIAKPGKLRLQPSRRFKPYFDEWKMKKEADG